MKELLEQSALLIEDGITCRDVNHKMRTLTEIKIYRFYKSPVTKWLRTITMGILMSLGNGTFFRFCKKCMSHTKN